MTYANINDIESRLEDAALFFDMPEADKYDREVADEIVRTIESELDCYGCVTPDALKEWAFSYELDAALAQFNGRLFDDEGTYCDEQYMREVLEESIGYMDAIDAAWYARNN